MFKLLTDLKIAGVEVKFICCDDSGENKSFYDACQSKCYLITFEFSGPRTPQRNGKVERKFQTLYGRICAMLDDAGLEDDVRSGVWSECANTVTFYPISHPLRLKTSILISCYLKSNQNYLPA
jgi:hypothetical protein